MSSKSQSRSPMVDRDSHSPNPIAQKKSRKSRSESGDRMKSENGDKDRSGSPADRSRSRSRSRSRDRRRRSRSRSRERRRSRSHSRDRRRRSRSRSRDDGYRLHLADIGSRPDKYEIEKAFKKYGKLTEVWVAEKPPCFAFVIFKNKDDADTAMEEMNGAEVDGHRIRVSWAKPRQRGGRGALGYMRRDDMKCYSCGRFGHMARNCFDRRGG